MFERVKKVKKKIDISLKMYFKASATIVQKWPYQGDFGSYNKAFYKKNAPAFLDTVEIVLFLLFYLFKHFPVKMCI